MRELLESLLYSAIALGRVREHWKTSRGGLHLECDETPLSAEHDYSAAQPCLPQESADKRHRNCVRATQNMNDVSQSVVFPALCGVVPVPLYATSMLATFDEACQRR
jgi:hypothetical protein